ncbi:MAG TPA: hypothetical protein VHN36_20625 [Ilumatobacteraceae bacterium]|nr:hypothetical protein [Ilumatobacteraceae bacterium]
MNSTATFPATIEVDDVVALGNVDQALASFYGDAVAAATIASGVSEREIRGWAEDDLISEQGFRTQALRGPGRNGGAVLVALENAHVIRADSRRGAQWYELAHDRLVAPVRESNSAWRTVNLSALQIDAINWDRHGRADAFLATGEVLRSGEAWSKAHSEELMAVDRDYLDASLANERGVLLVARASRRARASVLAALVLAVLALCGGFIAYNKVQDGHRLKASEADARAAETVAKDQSRIAGDSEAAAKASEAQAKASEADAKVSEADAKVSEKKAKDSEAAAQASEAKAKDSEAAARVSEAKAKDSEAAAKVSEAAAQASALLAGTKQAEAEAATRRALLAEARARAAEAATKTEVCGELVSTKSLLDDANEQLRIANEALGTSAAAYTALQHKIFNQLGSIIASSPATVEELKAALSSLQGDFAIALPSPGGTLPATC